MRSYFVKGHEYVAIVENTWHRGRVHQRTVVYLGRRDRLDRRALDAVLEKYGLYEAGVRARRRERRSEGFH